MANKEDGGITGTEKWIFGAVFFCLVTLGGAQYTDHATLSAISVKIDDIDSNILSWNRDGVPVQQPKIVTSMADTSPLLVNKSNR